MKMIACALVAGAAFASADIDTERLKCYLAQDSFFNYYESTIM